MQVTLKIFRYNPEKDKKPSYKTYKLEAVETDRVLDLSPKTLTYLGVQTDGELICAFSTTTNDTHAVGPVSS